MDHQYCVVLCGLQADAPTASDAWPPVAAALKLDQAEFARRVIAALPLIVRRDLDQTSAERIVGMLQAMHVDARALPDDEHLVYIRHGQAISGPLPQSALGDFIAPGDAYQLRGSTPWLPWPAAVDEVPAPAPMPAKGVDVHDSADAAVPLDEAIETPADDFIDEPNEVAAPSLADDEHEHENMTDAMSIASPAESFTSRDDARHAMPPPLPEPLSLPDQPSAAEAAASPGPATAEASAADARMPGDELDDPSDEASMPSDPEMDLPTAEDASDAAPATRSRGSRLLVLLILAGLAYWAYVHWIANTNTSQPPGAAATAPPPKSAATDKLDVPPKATLATVAKPAAAASLAAATSAAIAVASSSPAPAASSSAATASGSSAPAAASSATTPAKPQR